ncbi:MAG: cation-translocating P-type ATPase [Nanobdellota archaeon]
MSQQKKHKIPLKKLFSEIRTSEKGLSQEEASKRIKEKGKNKLTEKKDTPQIIKFLLQFKNFFSILLLIGAGLSFISDYISPGQGSDYIGWALLGVTVLNALFTYLQEFKAEQAMKSFKNLMTTKVTVIRDGKEKEIDSENLVPGDIFLLREGDKIPADARIIECFNLKVDHSTLTGESEPQLRSLKWTNDDPILSRNMIFSGTLVQNGSGKAVVLNTGDDTKIGQIATMTRSVEKKQTHMQLQLAKFIKIISSIAITLGFIFFLLGFLQGNTFWVNMVFAIGIIVANVPEGLLPTVTLTLSIAAQKMAKKNALVKNIDSIETLGSLTTICSDKTGTLTKNILSVNSFYMNGNIYNFNEENKSIKLKGKEVNIHEIPGSNEMKDTLINCNNSTYDVSTEKSSGDPTEICLKKFISNFTNIEYFIKKMKRIFEIPFESSKKYMITANSIGKTKKAYIKGAPEVLINKCTYIFSNGKFKKLTKKEKKKILDENYKYSSQGYRVLGFASKKLTKNNEKNLEKENYIFYGLIMMQDPPRPEVKKAVEKCKKAGIKIIVISGDQGNTVKSIANQVGIVSENNAKIITSEELSKMDDNELKQNLDYEELIFARSLPEDKLRIVKALQEKDEIVAVTGDGVNDSPALKKADVGVSMGITGTDVAKDSSDIVLLDDNFATISKAIEYGRTVYDNIQSFIMYILTSNGPEIIPYLLFVLLAPFNWPLALTVLLILAIDLGTDMLPAIGLGVEPPSSDIMERKPRDPNSKLCNNRMILRSYGYFGPLQALFSFLVFFSILFQGGWEFSQGVPSASNPLYQSAVTGFFATIIITQMFNVFACRTSKMSVFKAGILKNKIVLLGIASETILLLLLIFFHPLSKIFSTNTFPLEYLPWMFLAGAFLLASEELRKYMERNHGLFKIR